MTQHTNQPYGILCHKFVGNEWGGYTYELTFTKSMETIARHKDICDGMNYPRAKTWLGRVWNALRNR